jgi:hypothetical protein
MRNMSLMRTPIVRISGDLISESEAYQLTTKSTESYST